MRALLYFDALGTKALWKESTPNAVLRRFKLFRDIVRDGIQIAGHPAGILDGIVESDSAALLFAEVRPSLEVACAIFRRAFGVGVDDFGSYFDHGKLPERPGPHKFPLAYLKRVQENHVNLPERPAPDKFPPAYLKRVQEMNRGRQLQRPTFNPDPGLWLRGVIQAASRLGSIRERVPLSARSGIASFHYARPIIDALHVEKSGAKGMRLLIDQALIDGERVQANGGRGDFDRHVIRRLDDRFYPPRIRSAYSDLLWMGLPTDPDWDELAERMELRKLSVSSVDHDHTEATRELFIRSVEEWEYDALA